MAIKIHRAPLALASDGSVILNMAMFNAPKDLASRSSLDPSRSRMSLRMVPGFMCRVLSTMACLSTLRARLNVILSAAAQTTCMEDE